MHFDLWDLMFSDLRSDLIAVDLISELGLYVYWVGVGVTLTIL